MKKQSVITLCAVLFAAGGVGCSGGKLSLRSANEGPNILVGNFTQTVYGFDDKNNLDVVLIEGDSENPTQAVHIQMYWKPRAGKTPIDQDATSAVVHYIVFTEDGAGVYSGAGFLFPENNPGANLFRADLRNASMRLLDSSDDFLDQLGLAIASGGFGAKRDDVAAQRALRNIRLRLHERLGYPRLVSR